MVEVKQTFSGCIKYLFKIKNNRESKIRKGLSFNVFMYLFIRNYWCSLLTVNEIYQYLVHYDFPQKHKLNTYEILIIPSIKYITCVTTWYLIYWSG